MDATKTIGIALLLAVSGCMTTEGPVDTPPAAEARAPGRVPLRRLTRNEYDRTVASLIGVDLEIARDFPVDDSTDGFDVVAEGLSVSPLLVEMYEQGAANIAAAITNRPVTDPIADEWDATDELFVLDEGKGAIREDHVLIWSNGSLTGRVSVPIDGVYRLYARVWASQAGDELAKVRLGEVSGEGSFHEVYGDSTFAGEWIRSDITLRKGIHYVELAFVNDYYDDDTGDDRNVFVDGFRLEGPAEIPAQSTPAWDRVMTCDPVTADDPLACVRQVVEQVAPRAWRRPLEPREVDEILGVAVEVLENDDPPLWAAEFALRTVFASPDFVFLVEPEVSEGATGAEAVDPYALAARVSYLFWGTAPDDELWALAESGEINDPEVLHEQVKRMMYHEKAWAMAEDFGSQWLGIRAVDDAMPDFWYFPTFQEPMRASMKEAMQRQFLTSLWNGAPMTQLIDGTEMWVDKWTAPLVGITNIDPNVGMVPVDASAYGRRGMLTQPGLLMATSYPTRTSPVRRGVWVLNSLLCDEPPPPPPNVEGFPEPTEDAATVRERLAAHRTNPSCAGCHEEMDNIGLGFEHYNGIGMWRDYDQGEPIDASGVLDDEPFYGIEELATRLANDERYVPCVVEKAFTYAHRRAPTLADAPYLADIEQAFRIDNLRAEALFTAIVQSPTFREVSMRAPEPETDESGGDTASDEGGAE